VIFTFKFIKSIVVAAEINKWFFKWAIFKQLNLELHFCQKKYGVALPLFGGDILIIFIRGGIFNIQVFFNQT
jgi:hypothetical protein